MSAGSWQGTILHSKGLRAIQFCSTSPTNFLAHFFQEI